MQALVLNNALCSNESSVNVSGRKCVHNFEKTFSSLSSVLGYRLQSKSEPIFYFIYFFVMDIWI